MKKNDDKNVSDETLKPINQVDSETKDVIASAEIVSSVDGATSKEKYVMKDEVIEKYTKYPLDDYYAAYYDTLASGKKYRGFSWKAFFFGGYWAAFRQMNSFIILWLFIKGLLGYYAYGYLDTMAGLSGSVEKVSFEVLYPFSKLCFFGFFISLILFAIVLGFIGDFVYAKYGVLYNKDAWSKKKESYKSYDPWGLILWMLVSKIVEFVCLAFAVKVNIPIVIHSVHILVWLGLLYLIYDFIRTDPKKLVQDIGSKENWINATAVKSEVYFKGQFRKYEKGERPNYNWVALVYCPGYAAVKGWYKMVFLFLLA